MKGEKGTQGIAVKGPPGERGSAGPQGPPGPPGNSTQPFTGNKGSEIGPKGDTGMKGEKVRSWKIE